eukprot:TRINITY_DN14781_c0_g1_i1.p1 TRINITY_DN14781_c0_g1~~TRINITY_DN14781_c0_g1_i1.p1  ORF type:complete len:801 (-),score=192.38 TRINITY_DN14781_c0_g1_i1:28-2430(-)
MESEMEEDMALELHYMSHMMDEPGDTTASLVNQWSKAMGPMNPPDTTKCLFCNLAKDDKAIIKFFSTTFPKMKNSRDVQTPMSNLCLLIHGPYSGFEKVHMLLRFGILRSMSEHLTSKVEYIPFYACHIIHHLLKSHFFPQAIENTNLVQNLLGILKNSSSTIEKHEAAFAITMVIKDLKSKTLKENRENMLKSFKTILGEGLYPIIFKLITSNAKTMKLTEVERSILLREETNSLQFDVIKKDMPEVMKTFQRGFAYVFYRLSLMDDIQNFEETKLNAKELVSVVKGWLMNPFVVDHCTLCYFILALNSLFENMRNVESLRKHFQSDGELQSKLKNFADFANRLDADDKGWKKDVYYLKYEGWTNPTGWLVKGPLKGVAPFEVIKLNNLAVTLYQHIYEEKKEVNVMPEPKNKQVTVSWEEDKDDMEYSRIQYFGEDYSVKSLSHEEFMSRLMMGANLKLLPEYQGHPMFLLDEEDKYYCSQTLKNFEQERPKLKDTYFKSQYIIKISLVSIKPEIWRRFQVPGNISLHVLHDKVLCPILGWSRNYHGYYYQQLPIDWNRVRNRPRIEVISRGGPVFGPIDSQAIDMHQTGIHGIFLMDDKKAYLADVLKKEGDKLRYVYDLGDNWTHNLVVEKVFIPENPDDLNKIELIDGDGAIPPEDGHGNKNYFEKLQILSKGPSHKKYLETRSEVLGAVNYKNVSEFDPFSFNVKAHQIKLQHVLKTEISPNDASNFLKFNFQKGEATSSFKGEPEYTAEKRCVCGSIQNLKKCARCKIVYYCSVDCQRKDWRTHKENCSKIPQ